MGSNDFLDNTIPHWGKLQLARQQFEGELCTYLAKEMSEKADHLSDAGILLAGEVTSDKRRDGEYFYYFGSSRVQSVRGLSLHKSEELRLDLGYSWARSPETEQDLLPYAFLWFNFVDLKNPKTWQSFFDGVANKLPEIVFRNIWRQGAYLCFEPATYCRSLKADLNKDLGALIGHLGKALPKD